VSGISRQSFYKDCRNVWVVKKAVHKRCDVPRSRIGGGIQAPDTQPRIAAPVRTTSDEHDESLTKYVFE